MLLWPWQTTCIRRVAPHIVQEMCCQLAYVHFGASRCVKSWGMSAKEQCLALGTQLRTKFKPRMEDYKIYRIYPGGDTEFLHPKDGVFSEKVNEGRSMVGHNSRRIGQNVNPSTIKFSGRNTYET